MTTLTDEQKLKIVKAIESTFGCNARDCEGKRGGIDNALEQILDIIQPKPEPVWPSPTPLMLTTPEFNAVWDCIKSWDINVPHVYRGYCGANGNHVRAILDALSTARILPAGQDGEV